MKLTILKKLSSYIKKKREEIKLNKLLKSKATMQGPVQKKFEESKKAIKIKELSHFSDEAMNGNSAHLIFNDFRAGKNTLISCFIEYPEMYLKFLNLFKILTNIDTLLTKPGDQISTSHSLIANLKRCLTTNLKNC